MRNIESMVLNIPQANDLKLNLKCFLGLDLRNRSRLKNVSRLKMLHCQFHFHCLHWCATMNQRGYDELLHHIAENLIADGHECMFDRNAMDVELTRLYESHCIGEQLSYTSLESLIHNLHVVHIRKSSTFVKKYVRKDAKLNEALSSMVPSSTSSSSFAAQTTTRVPRILRVAKELNYSPYLVCKCIVEQYYTLIHDNQNRKTGDISINITSSTTKLLISNALRDPFKHLLKQQHGDSGDEQKQHQFLLLKDFANEIQQAVHADPLYGPIYDQKRHMIGIEYEVVLQYQLQKLQIPFTTESQLREIGTSKTPDILFQTPIGIRTKKCASGGNDENNKDWTMICWIDSKALFGDVDTHNTTVSTQAQSYVHRFGPGAILYWFGHSPQLLLTSSSNGDSSIIPLAYQLPNEFLLPTGKILVRNTINVIHAAKTSK